MPRYVPAARPAIESAVQSAVAAAMACLALGVGAVHADGGRPHAIQPLGSFHEGEAVARHGERWLALWTREDGSGGRLSEARVRVAQVEDPLMDEAGRKTGQAVSVPVPAGSRETPIMLLRGPGLNAGAFAVARVEDRGADGLPAYTVRLGGQESRVDTRCAPHPAPDEEGEGGADVRHARCRIELTVGARRQTLVEMAGGRDAGAAAGPWRLGDDAAPHLIFAGDLDGDGRVDLLFETTDHYNLSRPALFLSGAARGQDAVRRVSEHRAVGC